jgi:predicted  nucleic acid-binding Zn-ribbon protein
MSEKRVLRKMKKLASRINGQMETVRDIMEDLEIEFELLQNQISKLEAKKGSRGQEDELEVIIEDEEEIIDIENTSSVTVKQKF